MELNTESSELRPGSPLNRGLMNAAYKSQPWYETYMAALFKSDRGQIGEDIRRAELMILNRERELFTGPLEPKEQRALNNALHPLRALIGCLKL